MLPNRRSLFTMLVVGLVSFGVLSAYSSGPPVGVTGAPGESNCTVCHFSFPLNSGPGAVVIGGADYIGNASQIPLSVTIQNPQTARNGFQMTVRDAADLGQPGLQPQAPAIQTNGLHHVNHTSSGNMQSSWTTTWSVPAGLAPGPVTVYAAGNATNMDNTFFGDLIYTGSKVVYQSGLTSPSSNWQIGQLHALNLDLKAGAAGSYIMVVALDTTPTNLIGPFTLPLNPTDPFFTLALSLPQIFQNFIGAYDVTGMPLAPPQVFVPGAAALVGLSLNFAYVTLDPALTQVTDVSNRLTVTFTP